MAGDTLNKPLRRYLTGIVPLAVLSGLLFASMLMMNAATQNSAIFGRMYSPLLVVNVLGVVLLIALIALNLMNLIEQYRARAMGTRLALRLLVVFTLLSVIPVSVVLFFSIQTLNRGIDHWFDVRIEQALDDALALGRTALDAIRQDLVKNLREMAAEIEPLAPADRAADRRLLAALNELRERYGITELTLFAQDGKIIASSGEAALEAGTLVPDRPGEPILAQVRQGLTYATLDAQGRTGLRLRVVTPVYGREVGAPLRMLQALQQLPPRYAKLGESVQNAYAEYEKLLYLRGPLKFGFTLTLLLVALTAMLIAVWAAILSARRLTAPLGALAEGVRAVTSGDYRKELPVTSHDEIGILVRSFNDMTRRIHRAQSQIKRSQQEAERARAYLETVLTHLSSGVLSFDARGVLRTHNAAAAQVLEAELTDAQGRNLAWIAEHRPALASFVEAVRAKLQSHEPEWQAQVALPRPEGARTLILRGTRLPSPGARRGGYVVVFDDITALIQAQRDAAWREVARRMAHEIKNPLTPIQLSAERVRHKYLLLLPEEERATLDRATRTIIEQVESLKTLVNAFADYARSQRLEAGPVDLNALIRDVVELYQSDRGPASPPLVALRGAQTPGGAAHPPVALKTELDPRLPVIQADAGRLRQVLHNLLINARDALVGTPRPVVRIRTRALHEAGRELVELRIEDNGPGFPDALMEHLFEPYVTSKEKGTGLGLAIVKRIVEEHGGVIAAENLKGGGASVTIQLPLTPPLDRHEESAESVPRALAEVTADNRRRA